MAYQPKSYKKFVATAATATLVATAVVPAAFADEATTAAFTDVPASYDAAVSFLVENNFAVGLSETQFGISAQITRGDAAVVIAKAAGLMDEDAKASGFTDVPARGAIAVNSLKAAGVVNGTSTTKFGWDQPIKRGDAAIMFAKAFGLTEGSASDVDFTDVPDRYKEAVAALLANDVTNGINATQYGTDNNIKRGDFAKFVYALKDRIELPSTTPAVASVSAINAKQLVVTFNTAVDVDTLVEDAANDDNSLLDSVTVVADAEDAVDVTASNLEGELSKDGKTFTITNTSSTEYFDGEYTVTLDDSILSVDGKELTPFITKIDVEDTVAPKVSSVSYDAAEDLVTVTLSEAIVANPDVLRVNGVPVAFTNADTAPITELTFERPDSVATGSSATIYIAGAEDFNENVFEAYNGSVTFTKDASKLGVSSLTQADSDTLRVKFNKKIDGDETDVAEALTILVDGGTFDGAIVSPTLNDTTGTSFDVNFDSDDLYGTGTTQDLVLSFAKDALTDIYGNKNAASSSNFKMTKDTVAPVLSSTTVSSDKKTITLTYNEGVTGVETDKFVIRRDGVAVDTSALTIESDANDNKKVNITVTDGSAFTAGNYSIRLAAEAVEDLVEGNESAATTTSVTVSSGTATTTNLLAVVDGDTPNTFEVSFEEDGVAQELNANALNASNYKLDGKALPANTDIYFQDSDKEVVVIELQDGSVNFGVVGTGANAILSVSGVKSAAGKTVVSSTSTVLVQDNTAATLTSGTKVGNSVIVSFNEAIDTDVDSTNLDVTDFVVTDSTGEVIPTTGYSVAAVTGNANQVQLNFTAIPTGAVTVKTASAVDLTDINFKEVAAGSSVVAK